MPPTPAARTPHPPQPPHNLRQATSYTRLPVWKEYPPPAEVRWRERPNAADGLDALQALGAVLPDDGYRGMADRDTTRIAGDWERQVSPFSPSPKTPANPLSAHETPARTSAPDSLVSGDRIESSSQEV
jgi:hypothetical protein